MEGTSRGSDAAQSAPLTPSSKVVVVCRRTGCNQKIAVAAGAEGTLSCPRCGRYFWVTTRTQSAALHALCTLLHNQEGIALAAMTLVGLAAVWISLLWYARETYRYTVQVSLVLSLLSWLVVTWTLRRPHMDNLLRGSLKEARAFFLAVCVSSAIFFALYIWRFGTTDPLLVSHSLLQLEQLRDRYDHGYLMHFLQATWWKFAFAAITFLTIWLRIRSLRNAIRNVTSRTTAFARLLVYMMTAACALTFGGSLHDGAISRVEPVLRMQSDQLIQGYAEAVKTRTPAIINEIVAQLLEPPPQHQQSQTNQLNLRFPVHGTPNSPHALPRNGLPPDHPDPGAGPGPDDGRPPPDGPKLWKEWSKGLSEDSRTITNGLKQIDTINYASTPHAPYDINAPSSISLNDVRRLNSEPAPRSVEPVASTDEDAQLTSFLDSGLEYALDGTSVDSASLIDSIDQAEPFKDQLKAVTEQLINGPALDALRGIISDVLAASLKQAGTQAKVVIKRALQAATPASPLGKLKTAVSNLRDHVINTAEWLTGKHLPKPYYIDTATEAMHTDFESRWRTVSANLPGASEASAESAYTSIDRKIAALPPLERAVKYTNLSSQLMLSDSAMTLESIESTNAGTHTISTAVDRANQAAQAAAEAAIDQANQKCCKRCEIVDGYPTNCVDLGCGPQCAGAH